MGSRVPLPLKKHMGTLEWIDPAAEVYISWETAELEESQVEWGTNPSNLDNTLHNSTAVNVHHIKLDGLTANTRYYYRTVRSETSNENTIRTFKTAPISDQDFMSLLFRILNNLWVLGIMISSARN